MDGRAAWVAGRASRVDTKRGDPNLTCSVTLSHSLSSPRLWTAHASRSCLLRLRFALHSIPSPCRANAGMGGTADKRQRLHLNVSPGPAKHIHLHSNSVARIRCTTTTLVGLPRDCHALKHLHHRVRRGTEPGAAARLSSFAWPLIPQPHSRCTGLPSLYDHASLPRGLHQHTHISGGAHIVPCRMARACCGI